MSWVSISTKLCSFRASRHPQSTNETVAAAAAAEGAAAEGAAAEGAAAEEGAATERAKKKHFAHPKLLVVARREVAG
jgi:hypothetical protein